MAPTPQPAAGAPPGRRTDDRSLWVTPRALGMHLTLLAVVPAFIGLFWWQVQRVRQGNTLSWAYVFEWPFFTGYAIYMWWKLVHDQPVPAAAATAGTDQVTDAVPADAVPADAGPAGADAATGLTDAEDEDEEMAAYNRYLAQLDASGRRKHW